MGIKTAMLTGDCQSAAMQAQEQVCDVIGLIPHEYNIGLLVLNLGCGIQI
jgi:hypothetical protein